MLYWIILAAIAVLLYIYISYYYRYPPVAKVLFAEAEPFPEELLYEKQPLVLMNATTFPKKLSGKTIAIQTNQWYKNNYKYLLILPLSAQEIHLLPPAQKLHPEATLMTLQMKPDQVLLLPFHWQYICENEVQVMGVHDWVSWLLP